MDNVAAYTLSNSIDKLTKSIDALQSQTKITVFDGEKILCPRCGHTDIPHVSLNVFQDVLTADTMCSCCRATIRKEVLDGRYIG